jgi:hypothetical protein
MTASSLPAANRAREPRTRKRLCAPTVIQSYSRAADNAWFFADGGLAECSVSREIIFGEITVPGKSWINLTHDSYLDYVFLAHDTPVNGYLCKGGSFLGPTEGAVTVLYPSGKLKTCWLAVVDSVVDGVPCARASFWADAFGGNSGTYFHENGRLKSCQLSRGFMVTCSVKAIRSILTRPAG